MSPNPPSPAAPDRSHLRTETGDTPGPGKVIQLPRGAISKGRAMKPAGKPVEGSGVRKLRPAKAPASKRRHQHASEENIIRIVVVDDHPLFRHGLVQLLNSEESFFVCGEASSAAEAMMVIRRDKPSMVIADLGLKGANGLELTKSLRAEFPRMPVLVLSMHDEPTYAVRSLRAGANGYVTKEEALSSVLTAVREVIDGRTYLSPGMASEVISNVVLSKNAPGSNLTDQLTDRELEILERIGQGEEVKVIAQSLHLSPKTVETHRAHIKEKLKLTNARQVARFAVQWVSARDV